jgi:hypothetical protein
VVDEAPRVRRIIGYVPQMLSADASLTGYENLLIVTNLYDLPRAGRAEHVREAPIVTSQEKAEKLEGSVDRSAHQPVAPAARHRRAVPALARRSSTVLTRPHLTSTGK